MSAYVCVGAKALSQMFLGCHLLFVVAVCVLFLRQGPPVSTSLVLGMEVHMAILSTSLLLFGFCCCFLGFFLVGGSNFGPLSYKATLSLPSS